MREEKRGQGVVEVGVRFVRKAKGAMGQDIRAIGEVETSGVKRSKMGSE